MNDMTNKPFTSNIIIDPTIQTTKHGYMSKCSLLPKESPMILAPDQQKVSLFQVVGHCMCKKNVQSVTGSETSSYGEQNLDHYS